ncbi:hypothetical protein EVAR_11619_1 [Eumeta japonica]|uniref:Uncharacterized protein n=1 Tax=Eumeta variegata TaxID=151549 RepID=A0A4C1WXM8_EUMVA|nr:hypothetical protein EVAR_11619_1 [Eumeta japonica]
MKNTTKGMHYTVDDAITLDMENIMKVCNETFPIETGYLHSLNESGSFPDETDETPKCYIRCVLEKTGIFTGEEFDATHAALVLGAGRAAEETAAIEEAAGECAPDTHWAGFSFIPPMYRLRTSRGALLGQPRGIFSFHGKSPFRLFVLSVQALRAAVV